MKVKSKEVKECEMPNGDKTMVLDLMYTHKGETGRVLVKDYDDSFYSTILKQVRKEVIRAYDLSQNDK